MCKDPSYISAIIVNHNAGILLRECLLSVLGQTEEAVVVDNASTDGSLDSIKSLPPADGHIRIIRNESNLGFAAACNAGAKLASCRFLLFLNPDSSMEPTAAARLLRALQARPDAGMAGGLLTNPDGTEQPGGRRHLPSLSSSMVGAFGLSRLGGRYLPFLPDFRLHRQPLPEQTIEVEAISGACMLVRREAMEDVGPLDEGYFMHCEDLDWCMRFRQKGWKTLFVPDAKVMHHKGVCSRSRPIFVEWHKHKGMTRYYRKFFRDQYPVTVMWLVASGVWLRFAAVAAYHSFRQLHQWLRHARPR
jgi:GT2 family glycosyltransferase